MLFLFDIDGTLTNPRCKISSNMISFLQNLKKYHHIGIVGGSDFNKAKEQIGDHILNLFDYVFSENGLVYYKNGKLVHQKSFVEYIGLNNFNELITYAQNYIDKLNLPFKTSKFIEGRNGMINVSPVGRDCTFEQRNEFEKYDKIHNIRKKMIDDLKIKFKLLNLNYSIGGQISFDVFPIGWDKTFCLNYLNYNTIHFFGDKTEFGGNDYEIFNDSRVFGHTVINPDDTVNQIYNIINKIIPVILCGGMGTRLFPLSRKNIPKQFLCLQKDSEYSLLQNTIVRLINCNINHICLLSNKQYQNILNHQLNIIKEKYKHITFEIFFEPSSKNTFPAIHYMLKYYFGSQSNNMFTNLLFMPSDHIYDDKFNNLINMTHKYKNNHTTIFGIKPQYPETGFGYIKFNNDDVVEFKEKPNLETAQKYLLDGNYCWNAGMFLFNHLILNTINNLYPLQCEQINCCINNSIKNNNQIFISPCYNSFKEISIDYALIEKINGVKMLIFDGLWSDIGSYNALLTYSSDYINYGSLNNYVNTKKPTILSNVSNLTVVETEDCILVSDINKSQEIKQTFDLVKKSNQDLITNKYIDYRPWGYYEVLQDMPTFKLKKITVYPNKKLSLQSHNFRSEHWICLSGSGKAQINNELIDLTIDKSVFIKVNDKHRLINDGTDNLVIIELQTGNYFGEDDIIRYEDDYGR